MTDEATARRILLVAEGTLDRPLMNVLSMFGGITVTLFLGVTIFRSGLPTAAMIGALVALLVLAALVQGRYGGPREFRLEKPVDGGPLRLTGRFVDGEIRPRQGLELERATRVDDALAFDVHEGETTARYHLRPPAFSTAALDALARVIDDLGETSPSGVLTRYRDFAVPGMKLYDAKSVVLLRFSQKPAYTAIMWLVCGVTVLAWLFVLPLLFG